MVFHKAQNSSFFYTSVHTEPALTQRLVPKERNFGSSIQTKRGEYVGVRFGRLQPGV